MSESLRGWVAWPRLLLGMGWAIMLFELVFPFVLVAPPALWAELAVAGTFHLLFWVWLSAYPSLIWLEARLPF